MAENGDEPLGSLAAAAKAGDRRAFTELVRQSAPTLYALSRSLLGDSAEAQDVVQEAVLRGWQQLGELRDTDAVLGWLCRIARNACRDRQRKAKRRRTDVASPEAIEAATREFTAAQERPDDALFSAESIRTLYALIDRLKPKERVVFLMHVADDLSAAEIAVALDCPLGTVESRLSRGRKKLAKMLGHESGEARDE